METLTVKNPTSGIEHNITFSIRPSSPGKVVIRQDGRSIGKINIASKIVFCDKPEVYEGVVKNVDTILGSIQRL